ncbi:Far upstream element-binding protein 3, partial [Linderina pennispora]
GPPDCCQAAKQAVLDTIERHVASKEQQQRRQPPPQRFELQEETVTVMVPSARVGLIIGKGGESIRNIQAMSGARVQVQQDADRNAPERPVHLIGTPEQIEIAQARIMEIVGGEQGSYRGFPQQDAGYGNRGYAPPPPQEQRFQPPPVQFQEPQTTENMEVPAEAVGIVIGRGGETIKYLQQASGARIQIIQGQDRSAPFKPVTISGSPGACQRARQMIEEKVASVQ